MTDFLWGDLAPGLAPTTPGRSGVIDGAVPVADGAYGPMASLTTIVGADALPTFPVGHINFSKADGTYVNYITTATNWYTLTAIGGITSIASGHAVPAGDNESLERFGSKLLGTNIADGIRSYDIETGTDEGAVSGAPAARSIMSVGDVIVALDCDGDNRLIRNSDINDHTNWTSGSADKQPVEDGGALIAGVAVSQGSAIIFQREAIRLMNFGGSGGGPLYSLTLITSKSGAVSEKSVVSARGGAYFLDTDGFKHVLPGQLPEPIGLLNGISSWFLDQVGADRLREVEGSYDRFRQIIWWRFPVQGDNTSVFSRMIGFHIFLQKWVTLTVNTSALFTTALPGFTYDTMPDNPYDTIDDLPYDDRYWSGGEPLFAGFDSDFKFSTFSGTALAATLETFRLANPVSTLITQITPETDAATSTFQLGVADNINTASTWKTAAGIENSGIVRTRGRGKVIQVRQNIPAAATWTYTKGLSWPNEGAR